MKNGSMFGICLAFVMFGLDRIGSPAAWAVFWIVGAVQAATAAWLTWRRTGLPCMTLSMAEGALFSAGTAIVVVVGGYRTLATMPNWWIVLAFASGFHFGAALVFDSRAYPDKYRVCRARAERVSFPDLLMFRHIPDLR